MSLNTTLPEVPREIFDLSLDDADFSYYETCERFWSEIVDELLQPDYITRAHHNVATYDQGCRGPLCLKANRDHPRRKSPVVNTDRLREEHVYDPVLEYFHVVFKNRLKIARVKLMADLQGENT